MKQYRLFVATALTVLLLASQAAAASVAGLPDFT
jgi:hypothetical protein